jgi:3-deoxy-manno-octulosonate cytidylyltransferase (CMP-KDO synthetase)
MTSQSCQNGTERCAEALDVLGGGYDIVVNLQGDAPLTPAWFIEDLIAGLSAHPVAEVATPVLRCDGAALNGLLNDRRQGRVGGTTAVFGADHNALFFSKEVIPFTSETYANRLCSTMLVFTPTVRPRSRRTRVGRLVRLNGLKVWSN